MDFPNTQFWSYLVQVTPSKNGLKSCIKMAID